MPIESASYEQDRQRLMRDPTVQAMAAGMLADPDGRAKIEADEWAFTLACPREYHARTGRAPLSAHIGGTAEAVRRLMDTPREQWPAPEPEQLRLAIRLAHEPAARYQDCPQWCSVCQASADADLGRRTGLPALCDPECSVCNAERAGGMIP